MKKFIFTLIILFKLTVFPYGLLEFQIEEKMKQKIDGLLQIYDPEAKSIVIFDFYKTKEILPGTSLSGMESEFLDPKISNVKVTVYSNQTMDLKQLSQQISSALKIDLNRVKLNQNQTVYKKVEEEKIGPEFVNKTLDKMSEKIQVILGLILTVLIFVGSAFLMIYLKSRKKLTFDFSSQLQEAISQIRLTQSATSYSGSAASAYGNHNATAFTSNGQETRIQTIDLPTEGLVQYLADCYWTQNDSLAHSFWLSLSSQQKLQTLEQWNLCKEYSRYFLKLKPISSDQWQHSYYLNPLHIEFCSQEDLFREIMKNYSVWNLISPLRQEKFQISLKDRLEFSQSKNLLRNFSLDIKSKPRKLNSQIAVSELTLDDENYILSNLNTFDYSLMQNLPSLVWLALVGETDRMEILSHYDARSLSEVLVGPEQIIDLLMSSISDKKKQLILSYKNKVQPDRQSPVYLSLVEQILMSIEQKSILGPETYVA